MKIFWKMSVVYSRGSDLIVFTFRVTSSPIKPSPLVVALIYLPFSYDMLTQVHQTLVLQKIYVESLCLIIF